MFANMTIIESVTFAITLVHMNAKAIAVQVLLSETHCMQVAI